MLFTKLGAPLLALALIVGPAQAQDADPAYVEANAVWTACQATTADPETAEWVGWHRDYGNGYGDSLEFYDMRYDEGVSALMESRNIDGIMFETSTSCYRPDGTLAWVAINASSPEMLASGEEGPAIERWGSIAVAPDGKVVANLGSLSDVNGANLGGVNSTEHALARPCGPIDLRLTLADVQKQIDSELGDIDGKRPAYTPNAFAWCDTAAPGPGPAF
jgi:hypothetical protein